MTRVHEIVSEKDLQRAFSIRIRVFVREQGVPEEIELDRDDQRATHHLARMHGKPVETTRLVIKSGEGNKEVTGIERSSYDVEGLNDLDDPDSYGNPLRA